MLGTTQSAEHWSSAPHPGEGTAANSISGTFKGTTKKKTMYLVSLGQNPILKGWKLW